MTTSDPISSQTTTSAKVVVIGSTNWDICLYLPHLPKPGETVGSGRLKTNLGGKGANQAIACLKSGASTYFISCIGNDNTGQEVLEQLQGLGLNTERVSQVADTTGTACIFIDDNAENCIGLTPGANDHLSTELVTTHTEIIKDSAALLLQLETPIETVVYAAQLAKSCNKPVILNPAPARELPANIFPYLSLITPNESELNSLTGLPVESLEEITLAAKSLLDKGVAQVLVTLGEAGALLVNKNQVKQYTSYPVKALDTTAAGDTFNGYLASQLAIDWDFDRAVPLACAAAALSVTKEGAIASIPDRETVEDFLASRKS
ncbi:ribokinase [Sessilibacter sp. MAH4]